MRRLKIGTLVWHKKYGRGITSFVEGTDGVYFEKIGFIVVPRKEIFTKGDMVYNTSWNGGREWDKEVYTFYDAITHSPKCKSKFTLKRSDGKIIYVISIKHAETEYDICEEKHKRFVESLTEYEYHNCKCSTKGAWDKFREESRKHAQFAEEEIARNKQTMMNDLHLLTLEATAKEMLESIRIIRDGHK